MKATLISRSSNNKIRIVNISCNWNDKLHAYVITRSTSQLNGKITNHPNLVVSKGKAKRTITEQATLEYNSRIKKYLDKGYRNITEFGYSALEDFNPEKVFPKEVVDTNGHKKPMLAKKYSDVALSIFENPFWASKKLDGVRMMLHNGKDGLSTSSRGGGDYNVPASAILSDPVFKQIFTDPWINSQLGHKEFALDGELYIHGKPLPYISGICRKITVEPEHKELVFNVYDIAIDGIPFYKRLSVLEYIAKHFSSQNFFIVKHVKTSTWTEIKILHDKWVMEGYEGCVIRHPDKNYGYGKKDNRMIKIKEYEDAEFIITGITEKLREEDFVFNLITDDGKAFEAKPSGTREQRQEYRKNLTNIIGQKGTIQYFGFSPDGIPNLPIFKNVRYSNDID